jgi:LysM repeat protein
MPAGSSYHHTVIHGETLYSIADHYQANYLDIMRANNIHNASFIITGQILIIPDYRPPAHMPASTYTYHDKSHYAPPAGPPPAPMYNDAQDDYYGKPKKDYKEEPGPPPYEGVPPAPGYQAGPALPLLPVADHPIEVVVNGGTNWVGKVTADFPDPNGITTLVVSADGLMTPTVRLRSGDYEVKGAIQLEPEFGADMPRFVFRYIPPGDYDVWLEDPEGTPLEKQMPSQKVQVRVDPGKRVYVDFEPGLLFSGPTFAGPDGWFLADWHNPSVPRQRLGGWSNILVHTPASGLNVLIESEGGGYKSRCFTGSKGPGACDFAGLSAGLYLIQIEGTGYTVKTYMDGNAYATFTFARQPVDSDEDQNKVGPLYHD